MIKIIIHITNSKRDMYGNCYHFATLQRTDNARYIFGTVSTDSNVSGCLRNAGFTWSELSFHHSELPIREFNRQAKNLPHLEEEQIVTFAKG